jgi:hypothetical protein
LAAARLEATGERSWRVAEQFSGGRLAAVPGETADWLEAVRSEGGTVELAA